MSVIIDVVFFDTSGMPLPGLTPTFTTYATLAGVDINPKPAITNPAGAVYKFTLSGDDEVTGVIYVIDGGATARPRYYSGSQDPVAAPGTVVIPSGDIITIDWDDVIALAPELASVSPSGQQQVLDQVATEVKPARWGSVTKANQAALWLARHMGAIYGKGGGGQITSVHVGQVGKTFAANPMSAAALQTTRYGMEYLRLLRLWMPRFALT